MTRINTNVSSLTAQKTLARTNEQLQTALTRLSTGLRINAGKDDPAGLIASEVLGSSINNTQKAISNSQRANQMVSTADSALGQISSLLNDVRGLVTEAANKGVMSADQIAANQLQVDSSLDAINRIAQTTTFQGKKLLDGSLSFTTTAVTAMNTVTNLGITQANLGTSGTMTVAADITTAATQASMTTSIANAGVGALATFNLAGGTMTISGTAGAGSSMNGTKINVVKSAGVTAGVPVASYDATAKILTVTINSAALTTVANIKTAVDAVGGGGIFTVGGTATNYEVADAAANQTMAGGSDAGGVLADVTFQLSGSKGSQVFQFKAGTTGAQVAAAINLATDATGVSAAYANPTLTLKSSDYGTAGTVDIKIINEGIGGVFGSGLSATHAAGTDIVGKINGFTASGAGNTLSVNTSTLTMSATVTAGSSTDFSFTINGGGAMFQLGPEVISSQQTRIGIQSVDTGNIGGTAGLMYQLKSGNSAELKTNASLAASITDQAISQVTSLRGQLGAFQKTALQTNINALSDTLVALTDAQSSIRDTDFASETANLTRGQILTQSGTKVLQIANKNPENVLSLLQ